MLGGQSNILPGTVVSAAGKNAVVRLANGAVLTIAESEGAKIGQNVETVIRAHRVRVGPPNTSLQVNVFAGRLKHLSYLGGTAAYFIDVDGLHFRAVNAVDRNMPREGDAVSLTIAAEDCVLLDERGRRIGP